METMEALIAVSIATLSPAAQAENESPLKEPVGG